MKRASLSSRRRRNVRVPRLPAIYNRAETLRRERVPEGLVRFWLGHASASVTDNYANGLREDLAWRQDWAQRIGLGFTTSGLHGVTNAVKIEEVRAA